MNEPSASVVEPARGHLEERIVGLVEKYRPLLVRLWGDRRRLAFANGVVVAVSLVALLFVVPPYFDSAVVILPDLAKPSSGVLSQLSGLASLSGLGGVNLGKGIAPEVYENLLSSESVLGPVFLHKYQTGAFAAPVNLIEYFELEPDESLPAPLRERRLMLDFLESFVTSMMRVDIGRISGITTVIVRMPESRLSADVANQVAASLDRYVVEKNREMARQTMEYIERRLLEVRDSLTDAEEQLRSFHQRNRMIAASPALALEQSRLSRSVDLTQAVYVELRRQYEVARIERQKDSPIVNFREEAGEPVEKSGPHRTIIMIIIMFVSAILTGLWSCYGSSVRRIAASLRGRQAA